MIKLNSEALRKTGRVSFWLGMIPMTGFALVALYGIYLGTSGKQSFTFTNSPAEAQSSQQIGHKNLDQ